MINIVNQVISKEFARFLKERGIYMDYVRNVMHYYHYDIAFIKKCFTGGRYHYVSNGFLWANAKYPNRIGNNSVNMSHFWEKIHSDWLAYSHA